MSEYSSLPQSHSGPFFTRLKSRTQSHFAKCRPWRELISHPSSYAVPRSIADFAARLKRNLNHFRVNYAYAVLIVLFLSLIYHPTSIIVFLVAFVLWHFLYFSRDEPIQVFGRFVDDRVVLLGLGVLTVVCLVLTRVWLNVLVAVLIGGAAVALHASFRVTEDLYLDEDELAWESSDGLVSVVGA